MYIFSYKYLIFNSFIASGDEFLNKSHLVFPTNLTHIYYENENLPKTRIGDNGFDHDLLDELLPGDGS